MFDPKDAGRLLREDWDSPLKLARELYEMLTSKGETRTVNNPVEIAVPKGQTALRISQAKAEPAPQPGQGPARVRSQRIEEAKSKIPPTPPPAETPIQQRNPGLTPDEIRPRATGIDHSSAIQIDDHVDDFKRQSNQPPISSARPFRQPTEINHPPGVQSGPGGLGSRRDQSAQQSRFAKSYQNPIFEVAEGEVKFSGISPVQFDRAPYVFNLATDQYEPIGNGDGPTAQPAFAEGSSSWGKIAGGQGPVHQVVLYADPDPATPSGDTVSCTFPGLDKDEKIPPNTWVFPVFVNGDGAYFCIIPTWLA